MTEKPVYVYYVEIKNIANRTLLTSAEIRTAFNEISTFEYSRDRVNSMLRKLGGLWYALDAGVDGQNSIRLVGNRVREEDLPVARFSKERVEPIRPPAGADIVERSYGVVYFPAELTSGCFIFLVKNHYGISITKIKDYIKSIFPAYNPIKTIIARASDVVNRFSNIQTLRYILLDNKSVLPAIGENVGDYQDRVTHPSDARAIYLVKRMKIDLTEQGGNVGTVLRRLARDFTGRARISDEDLRQFIADSNAHLIAVARDSRRQEVIDLTKDIYAFTYQYEGSFEKERFYSFCDTKFSHQATRRELISLARGIVSRISNVNNSE